jgi:hypothetical protein
MRASTNEPTAPQADDATPKSGRLLAGWIVTGVGAAGIGVSLVTGALVLSKKSFVEENCPGPNKVCTTEEGLDAAEEGRRLSTVSTVAFVVGAVGLVGGLYLVLSSDTAKRPEVAIGALPLPTGGHFTLRTRF